MINSIVIIFEKSPQVKLEFKNLKIQMEKILNLV